MQLCRREIAAGGIADFSCRPAAGRSSTPWRINGRIARRNPANASPAQDDTTGGWLFCGLSNVGDARAGCCGSEGKYFAAPSS
jgi:hypothetical protein